MLYLLLLITAGGAAEATLPDCVMALDLEDGWTRETQGPWRMRYDHRELLAMRHPWQPSRAGDFASVSRTVTVPAGWQGPVYMFFYCSDDYHTYSWRPGGHMAYYMSAEGFIGHRFKRVLVDDQVVWESDVADPVLEGHWRGTAPRRKVQLPVEPGQEFVLTLIVQDDVASTTVLEEDFYASGTFASRDEDPDAFNFLTHVYWGDLFLTDGDTHRDTDPAAGKRPTERKVLEVHNRRWPLPPFGDPWPNQTVALGVSAPAGVPAIGFPAQTGVPLHAGKVLDVEKVRLAAGGGKRFPAQKTATGFWPNNSVKWILFDFPVKPDCDALTLEFENGRAAFSKKVKVSQRGDDVRVNTGPLEFTCQPGNPIQGAEYRGKRCIESIEVSLECRGEAIRGTVETVDVAVSGPFRVTTDMAGVFRGPDGNAAAFTLRCSAYANLPYIKLWFRLFNDTLEDLPVSGLKVRLRLPAPPENLTAPSGAVDGRFRMVQRSETVRELDGAPVDALAPMFLAWDNGAIVVRNFRELFPKAASADGEVLTVDLCAGGEAPVVFTQGEAKSHEIWLALGGQTDPAQLAATVRQPPILQNHAYFCATGVIGPAKPHDNVPVLHAYMTDEVAAKRRRWEDHGQHFGVRHFPDSPPNRRAWANNYYERMLGLWGEWFMSGDRLWYDMAVDVCRHIMDVAIIHSEIPGKDWAGGMHGYGDNHVAGPDPKTLRAAGLDLYHKLTGDPDAGKDVLAIADFAVRSRVGITSSARSEAGPLYSLCTAYDETGDLKYRDAAMQRLEGMILHLDMRRGTWAWRHGSEVYWGNTPWFLAQAATPLYRLYRATGNVQAAQTLVAVAESIVCEETDWDQPGVVSGYSHNPRYSVTAKYDLLIIPMIFAAYELTEDPFFLEAATAQWNRVTATRGFGSILNCYYHTPWLIWYLKTYGVVEPADPEPDAEASEALRDSAPD